MQPKRRCSKGDSMRKKPEKLTDTVDAPLISQAKAAEMCGVTRAAIHDLVRRRRFRSVEVEGRDLVYLEEVETFTKEHE
ncbi:MAG: hypothetical protein QOH25_418 [Acidobacteriota bacterium]|nr:hypothetical protein [Acidobacteriota bacterium]